MRSAFRTKFKIMKLELKHLAPYLPYKLKLYNRQGIIRTMYTFESNDKSINIADVDCLNYKPILKPLSDLLKLGSNENWWRIRIETGICSIDYDLMQGLLKEHYDVFKLIDKGLAVNINDVSLADA